MDPVKDMCLDGLLSPDLVPHPGALEIKKVQSPIQIMLSDRLKRELLIENGYHTQILDSIVLEWKIIENRKIIESGNISKIEVQPQSATTIILPYGVKEWNSFRDYYLNVAVKLIMDVSWAKKDEVLYENQFLIQQANRKIIEHKSSRTIPMIEGETSIELSMNGWKLVFDKIKGSLSYYGTNEQNFIKNGPVENFFRPPTGIDYSCGQEGYSYAIDWYKAGLHQLNRKVRSVSVLPTKEWVQIYVECSLTGADDYEEINSELYYRVYGDGSIQVRMEAYVPMEYPFLPRVGVSMELSEELNQVEWYGRGPGESYPDRKQSVPMGLYEEIVDEIPCPYIVPVEHGGREDVQYTKIHNGNKEGIMIQGRDTFHYDIHHNTIKEYHEAAHCHELEKKKNVYLNLDGQFAGLGGDTGWYKTTHDEFLIKPGKNIFEFMIQILNEDTP